MRLHFLPIVTLIGLMMSLLSIQSGASQPINEENPMSIAGIFEVQLSPQNDETAPTGRMIINKQYQGAMSGSGVGQMISKRTQAGMAIYYAIEEFAGSIDGLEGGFTLVHQGFMSEKESSLDINILEGSGYGQFANISGRVTITQENGTHRYELKYELD